MTGWFWSSSSYDRETQKESSSMSPASPDELKLHRRLVDGDPVAPTELFIRYTEDLIEALSMRYGRIAAHNKDTSCRKCRSVPQVQ